MNNSTAAAVAIQADITLTCNALAASLKKKNFTFNPKSEWWITLHARAKKNQEAVMVGD